MAARSGIDLEEANQRHLNAGPYEYSVRLMSQHRSVREPSQGFREWEVDLERPIRLPNKAAIDRELGTHGVEQASLAHGDALHEAGRSLLSLWFAWYREHFTAEQWQGQIGTLKQQLDSAHKRVRAGDAAKLDAMLSEAALAQAEAQWQQARMREQIASTNITQRFRGIILPSNPALAPPKPLSTSAEYWRERILMHNHELGLARGETKRWRLNASRSQADRLPDPTLGLRFVSDRDGAERVVGVNVQIPLPGSGRAAMAEGVEAQANMASSREAAVLRKLEAEAMNSYATATSSYASWKTMRSVQEAMQGNADLMGRAYALGEAGLTEVLMARRQALDASLSATLAQIDAAEARYRLMLDGHELWPLDQDEDAVRNSTRVMPNTRVSP
ncbi:MAG: TolC family protein [Burkholderiales bacterium]